MRHIIDFFFFTDANCVLVYGDNDANALGFGNNIIGLILWMACVLYSSLRTASSSSKMLGSDKMLVHDNGAG